MILTEDVYQPLQQRDYMTMERILQTPIDTPMVITYYDKDGRHFQPCLREPGIKRDVVTVTVYPAVDDYYRLKLTWVGHGVLVSPRGMEYMISAPTGKEVTSCWRVLKRFEDVIMGEDE